MTGLVFFYYLRFWFEYQASPLGLEAVENSLDGFDHEFVWFEYVPFFVALFAEATWEWWWWIPHRPGPGFRSRLPVSRSGRGDDGRREG